MNDKKQRERDLERLPDPNHYPSPEVHLIDTDTGQEVSFYKHTFWDGEKYTQHWSRKSVLPAGATLEDL